MVHPMREYQILFVHLSMISICTSLRVIIPMDLLIIGITVIGIIKICTLVSPVENLISCNAEARVELTPVTIMIQSSHQRWVRVYRENSRNAMIGKVKQVIIITIRIISWLREGCGTPRQMRSWETVVATIDVRMAVYEKEMRRIYLAALPKYNLLEHRQIDYFGE
jgi:hypothetical protein